MTHYRPAIHSILIGAAIGILAAGSVFAALAAQPVQSAQPYVQITDQFGYVMTSDVYTNTGGWIDAKSGGVKLTLSDPDDGLTAPITPTFPILFYDQQYTSFRVDSNGILHFLSTSTQNANYPIPKIVLPNNFIAPFWSELYVGPTNVFTGTLYFQEFGAPGSRKAVIEFNNVSRLLDKTNPLTFEIILYENGDILFQYLQLKGNLNDCTVGIESPDGLDGIQYVYNSPGLFSGLALRFTRPPNLYGVRSLTSFASSLLVGLNGTVNLSYVNVGDANSTDMYEISFKTPPNWRLSLASPDLILVDADQDGYLETPSIQHESAFTLTLQASAPMTAQVGDYVSVPITVTSQGDPTRNAVSLVRFAVPAQFVHSFSDLSEFNSLGYLSPYVKRDVTLYTSLGRNHSLAFTPNETYFYAWDRGYIAAQGQVANIEYAIFDNRAGVVTSFTSPFNHNTDNLHLQDTQPAVAAATNGNVGILFLRRDFDAGGFNNVAFFLLGPGGQLITAAPITLTNQTSGVFPAFSAPRLAATTDGKFIATWAEYNSGALSRNIWVAEINPATGAVVSSQQLTNSTGSGLVYDLPQLAPLSNGRVVIAYREKQGSVYNMLLKALTSTGAPVAGSGITFGGLGAVQYSLAEMASGGNVLFAWAGTSYGQVSYAVLNNSIDTAGAVQNVSQPDASNVWAVGNLTSTSDGSGHAILAWMNTVDMRRIYYALINPDGSFATPPMIFKDAGAGSWGTNTSKLNIVRFNGFYQLFLPRLYK